MRALVLVALLCVGRVEAGEAVIWKCRDAQGGLIYQNAPCGDREKQLAKRAYDTVREDPGAQARVSRIQREMDARNESLHRPTYDGGLSNQQTPRDRQKQRCRLAREEAEDAMHRPVSSTLRIALDRKATEACFGL